MTPPPSRSARRCRSTPACRSAHLNLAIALLYGSHLDSAAPEARAAAAALPDRPQPSYVLGLIARGDNRVDEAAAAFRRVLEIDPADAARRSISGRCSSSSARSMRP